MNTKVCRVPNKCLDGTVVNDVDVDVLWFFAGSTPMSLSLNFYTDLIRPTIILENSIRNIHQAFSKNTSNSIRKRLMDQKKILNFHTEGDQGSLGVFRGPVRCRKCQVGSVSQCDHDVFDRSADITKKDRRISRRIWVDIVLKVSRWQQIW